MRHAKSAGASLARRSSGRIIGSNPTCACECRRSGPINWCPLCGTPRRQSPIEAWIAERNSKPKPFQWTAKADTILATKARARRPAVNSRGYQMNESEHWCSGSLISSPSLPERPMKRRAPWAADATRSPLPASGEREPCAASATRCLGRCRGYPMNGSEHSALLWETSRRAAAQIQVEHRTP